jgi:hypothetical protein
VSPAELQGGFEFGARPGVVVAAEQRRSPGQAGERLQRRFARHVVDVCCHAGRKVFLGWDGQLLGDRLQDGEVNGVMRNRLLHAASAARPARTGRGQAAARCLRQP